VSYVCDEFLEAKEHFDAALGASQQAVLALGHAARRYRLAIKAIAEDEDTSPELAAQVLKLYSAISGDLKKASAIGQTGILAGAYDHEA